MTISPEGPISPIRALRGLKHSRSYPRGTDETSLTSPKLPRSHSGGRWPFNLNIPLGTRPGISLKASHGQKTPGKQGKSVVTPFVMLKSPGNEILAKHFADMGEKRSDYWAIFSPIFVLQFLGKVGTRNFTRNPRQIP